MVPMALAVGEGGEQSAPLGRAVIGGLVASTIATLVFLPAIYTIIARKGVARSASLDPTEHQPARSEPQSRSPKRRYRIARGRRLAVRVPPMETT